MIVLPANEGVGVAYELPKGPGALRRISDLENDSTSVTEKAGKRLDCTRRALSPGGQGSG